MHREEYSKTDDGKQLCGTVLLLIHWAEKRDTIDKHRFRASCHDDNVSWKKISESRRHCFLSSEPRKQEAAVSVVQENTPYTGWRFPFLISQPIP